MSVLDPTAQPVTAGLGRNGARSPLQTPGAARTPGHFLPIEEFGELRAIGRPGGQGRVYRPALLPAELGTGPVLLKLYRRAPPAGAVDVLAAMVAWSRSLSQAERARLHRVAAWPLAIVRAGADPVGIAMEDVSAGFAAPFTMPSGRREQVLLALEHLLGGDSYLQVRGLGIALDTAMRAYVAEQVSATLAYLHRHGIVVSDIAPSNLLIAFHAGVPEVCFIDCDSMVFQGRQALTSVETADWNMPAEFEEAACTRAADAYKLGLVVLRLFARSHDARLPAPYLRFVPVELRDLLHRALHHDAANRPPAGEWQRVLGELRTGCRLNDRYPGPEPPPVPILSVAASGGARVDAEPVSAWAGGSAPAVGGVDWLRRTVVALWIVTGTVVLFLVLSHLFADALPVTGSGGGGAVSVSPPGQLQDPSQGYYQYGPGGAVPGGGQGGGAGQGRGFNYGP